MGAGWHGSWRQGDKGEKDRCAGTCRASHIAKPVWVKKENVMGLKRNNSNKVRQNVESYNQ